MKAKYLFLCHSSQWKIIKQPVQSGEDGVLTFRLLIKFFSALISEAEIQIYLAILMVSSDQMDLFWVDNFQ